MTDTDILDAPTPASWAANIRRLAADGRLAQLEWHNDRDGGRECACLMGAAGPNIQSVGDVPCAALHIPKWMALITVKLFDEIPETEIPRIAAKYADCAERWSVLTPDDWETIKIKISIYLIEKYIDTDTDIDININININYARALRRFLDMFDFVLAQINTQIQAAGQA